MSSKVLLIEESAIDTPDKLLLSCYLRHPKTSKKSLFLLSPQTKQVMELIKYEKYYQSWMIDDHILKDGSLYMVTPVNPLYILLPYLKKRSSHFMDLESLLEDEEVPDLKMLMEYCSCIEVFSDTKIAQGSAFFRYNESKTLEWLKDKVHHVAKSLEKNGMQTLTNCESPGFTQSSDTPSKELQVVSAWELVSEYLDDESSLSLKKGLNISLISVQDDSGKEPPSKKIKLDDLTPIEDYSKHNIQLFAKAEKLTPAQKKLKNADKRGMKSISAFFRGCPKQ